MSHSPTGPRIRNDIQGLRAIAVLAVVVFHASSGAWPTGGFVGVDVFFVISGFLITRSILGETERDKFTLAGFYQRRIRRLFPALVTVLLFTLVAGAVLLAPADYKELGLIGSGTAFFLANFALLEVSGYFGRAAQWQPLLHTWSLAVEEQFYILYPVVLLLVFRYARKAALPVLAVCLLLSLCLSMVLTEVRPAAAFFMAPTRAFELLIGCILALRPGWFRRLGQDARNLLSFLGLIMISGSIVFIDETMQFPGALALAPCLGAALVLAAGEQNESSGGRLISSPPFVLIGNISYSLYLWHWPLLVLFRHGVLGPINPLQSAGVVAVSFVVAYASWRWIEQPFIRGQRCLSIGLGMAAASVVAVLYCLVFITDGLPQRFGPQSQSLFVAQEDLSPVRSRCHGEIHRKISYDGNCVLGAPSTEPSVALWGDSLGSELSFALGERLAPNGRAVMQISVSACPPAVGYSSKSRAYCRVHNDETLRRLMADPRIKRVLLVASSSYPGRQHIIMQGMGQAAEALVRSGKRVTIVEPIPNFSYDPPSALGLVASRGGDWQAWGTSVAAYEKANRPYFPMKGGVDHASGVWVIRSSSALCGNVLCSAYSSSEGVLYFDATHLSMAGARRLAKAIPQSALD